MSDEPRTHRTKTGRVLTDADLEALADEAEQGYDIEHLAKKPGRPRMGSAPAAVVPVRLHADLHAAVKALAELERTSLSELVRDALREYLATPAAPIPLRTSSGRDLSDADLHAFADDAEAGYDVTSLRTRPSRRAGARAEVVPVRMPPELKAEAEQRAEAESTSVSEIVRAALRARLDDGDADPPGGGSRSRAGRHGPTEDETCRDYVVPRLKDAGWDDDQIVEQYRITDGRVLSVGKKHRRDTPLRADYVLEYEPGFQIAVVEAKRSYAIPGKGLQQAKRYASLLDVPFSYSTNGKGIVEDDRNTGIERDDLAGFPSPDVLWARYREWRGLDDDLGAESLLLPFNRALRNPDGSVKEPRYYQRTAINRAVRAILRGDDRLLLTMATGTGKTFVAMQLVWKLWKVNWRPGRNPRILYLADRNVLIDQPIEREFKPAFGTGEGSPIWKLRGGEAKLGREIYFGLYQQLADSAGGLDGMYREFAPDFFDLVIVDECHRGSARVDSSWRAILKHFAPAAQLGMTATPKRDESVDTYDYFGGSIFEYSLAQGIEDGFLAPYRVRRVVLSPDALGWAPDQGQLDLFGKEIPEGLYTTKEFERVVSLLTRTEAAAKHLTEYLQRTDRWAKTIVFCVNQEHADQMRRALHNANADLAKDHSNYVVRIVSEEGDVGRSHLSDFADTEKPFPVIATTSELLSTGVDAPTVKNIVLFRTVGSMALFKQMIGRGTRLFPDEDKLSFDIIDYSGATALFNDPEFDGPPELVVNEEIDGEGNVTDDTVVEQPEPTFQPPPGDGAHDDIPPDDLDEEPRAKFYVDDAEVWVTAEAVYHLDPNTERLRLVEYRDFVAETVRFLFPDANELRSRWRSRVGRQDVLDALARHGIDANDLVERTAMAPDVDPIDVLVHVAWNQPLATRVERARRVRREHEAFFEEFQPAAREVLAYLLDKYAEHGITELDDLAVLEVPPLSSLGTPTEIAARFGSPDALRLAVARLSELVYVA